jgi:hypothetical protein
VTIGHAPTEKSALRSSQQNRRQKDEPVYDIAMRRVFYIENISNLAKTYASVIHLMVCMPAGDDKDSGNRKVAENS